MAGRTLTGEETRMPRVRFGMVGRAIAMLNGRLHLRVLLVYLLVVAGHFGEHAVQAFQYYVLHWHPRLAGGVLGLYLPRLAQNEVLHIAFNSLQLTGLILLWPGFRELGAARRWWNLALILQGWHFFEHGLLLAQVLSGSFLFGAVHQTSLLEFVFPRLQLHLFYNLMVLIPTLIAVVAYLRERGIFPRRRAAVDPARPLGG